MKLRWREIATDVCYDNCVVCYIHQRLSIPKICVLEFYAETPRDTDYDGPTEFSWQPVVMAYPDCSTSAGDSEHDRR